VLLIGSSVVYWMLCIVFFSSYEIYLIILTSVPSITIGTYASGAFLLLKYGYMICNILMLTSRKQAKIIRIWTIEQISMASISTLLVIAGCVIGQMTGMIFSQVIVHPLMIDFIGLSLYCYSSIYYIVTSAREDKPTQPYYEVSNKTSHK
jgi:uncharacterized membrane protein